MTKKNKALSGLRSLSTLQTMARGAKPRGRQQVANRYARLENERARLEREIAIWENCRDTAVSRFAKVRQEIDLLRPLLDDEPAKKTPARNGRGLHRAKAASETTGPPPVTRRSMDLHY